MYRVALVTKKEVLPAKDFKTRDEADNYILEIAEQEGVKVGYIDNLETHERERIENL
jgi:hypothetical protein